MMKSVQIKKVIFVILSLVIGLIFIFSAYAKLPTLEQFGWTIVETTFLNWTAAEWLARILIGLEFALGILFLILFRIRKIAIPLALVTLLVFTGYLILVILQQGNQGNCGCFGEVLPMTPLESVYKNIGLIMLILAANFVQFEWRTTRDKWIITSIFMLALLLPFIVSPPESIYIYEKDKVINKPVPLSILYQSANNAPPQAELRKGKHVIAFMSMTCEHCRKAAKKMRIMKNKHPEIPFHIILNGDSINLKPFLEDTRVQNIPITHFNGVEQFVAMAGGHGLPSIRWISDTTLYRQTNYLLLDDQEILAWIR